MRARRRMLSSFSETKSRMPRRRTEAASGDWRSWARKGVKRVWIVV